MQKNDSNSDDVTIISEDEFFTTYLPVKNHIDKNASFEGFLFETYGDELAYVQQQKADWIFTYLEDDNGKPCIVSGFHIVNRIGYFVTTNPYNSDVFVRLDIDNNINVESGIYVFNSDEYSSVQDSLEDGSGQRLDLVLAPRNKDELMRLMMSFEAVVNALGCESWMVVFCDSTHEIEAGDINTLSDEEVTALLFRIHWAYNVKDVPLESVCECDHADLVGSMSVMDPESKLPVELSVYKDRDSKGIFAIDDSYLVTLSDEDPVSNPFKGKDIYLHDNV